MQAAQCTGVLCPHLPDDQLTSVLRETLLQTEGESDWSLLQARALALSAAVEAASSRIEDVGMEQAVVEAAVKFASSDRVSVTHLLHYVMIMSFVCTYIDPSVCDWTADTLQLHQSFEL